MIADGYSRRELRAFPREDSHRGRKSPREDTQGRGEFTLDSRPVKESMLKWTIELGSTDLVNGAAGQLGCSVGMVIYSV